MDEEKRNGKRSHGAVMALIFMLTIFTWGQVLLFNRPTPKEPAAPSAVFPDIPAVVEKCMPSSVIFQVRKTVLSDPSDSDSEKMRFTEAASGIIWEEREDELLVVTNNHVVEGADSIRVRFSPEKAQGILLTAKTLGRDQTADIAVVSIEKSQIPEDVLPLVHPAVRGDAAQERTPLLHQRGLSGFHKKDREKIDRLLTAFGKENSASCLLLDNNGTVLGQFSFENQLSGQFVSYAQKLLRSGKIYDDAEKPFRIQNGLHFPTRYVGLWDTIFLHDWEKDGVAYLIVISKEVHTVRDYWVFAHFALLAMGATVLISCVAAICVARLLTEPVLRMERTARRMSNLDFSEKCSYHGKDELGDLAGSLNFLSEKLEETIGKLQEANHQLEADLTAQKELEQMRRSFVASASHEFKTPLTLLRGYLEMLREQVLPPEAQAEAEETMIAEIDRMDNLVLDMLSASRLEVGGDEEPETPFDVKEVLNGAGRAFADVLKSRGITLRKTAPEEACVAVGNAEQIATVLTNFLSNAMNHTSEGGIIELRLEAAPKQLRISVFNQGDPIAQDAIKQIWEPFFRADRTRAKNEKGTGLGLSICREILKKHGSEYGVENTRDGVLFYFTLHRVPASSPIAQGE